MLEGKVLLRVGQLEDAAEPWLELLCFLEGEQWRSNTPDVYHTMQWQQDCFWRRPKTISTIHPLLHCRWNHNILGDPLSICPHGSSTLASTLLVLSSTKGCGSQYLGATLCSTFPFSFPMYTWNKNITSLGLTQDPQFYTLSNRFVFYVLFEWGATFVGNHSLNRHIPVRTIETYSICHD